MTGHGHLPLLLLLALLLPAPGLSQSVCMQSGPPPACFDSLRSLLRNTSAFWFGTAHLTQCPNGSNTPDPLCSNSGDPVVADSIASRMLGDQNYDLSSLNTFLSVSFQSPPGEYSGCGNHYRTTQLRTFDLDPLSPETIPPWDLRMRPSVTWEAEPGRLYTVLLLDVGPTIVHGLYINIPGGEMTQGQAIVPYRGPGNPVPRPNSYVYALFTHDTALNATAVTDFYESGRGFFNLFASATFIRQFGLQGPLGANMMLARSDAYSVSFFERMGVGNYCPYLLQDAMEAWDLPLTRSFAPQATVSITFNSEAIQFSSCCSLYNFPDANVTLNPLGDAATPSVYLRAKPTFMLYTIANPVYFTGKQFTLMLVDVTPMMANPSHDRLTVHWQVVNIPGLLDSPGEELLGYVGMGGQLGGPSLYVYLLLEQTRGSLPPSTPPTYAGNCTGALAGRCEYRVQAFMEENGLKLVGVNWQRLTPDPYSRHLAVTTWGLSEGEVCGERLALCNLLRNTSAFWFGTDYLALCPNGTNSEDPMCSNNGDPTVADSIASRMLGDQNYDLSSLNTSLSVSFQSSPGTYWGCGSEFQTTQLRSFRIDPLNPEVIPPWHLRMTPSVTWEAEPGQVYTMLVYDAAPLILHGLYINIRGGDMTQGQAVRAYRGPRNPLPRVNAYVFALFTHPEPLSYDDVRDFYLNSTQRGMRFYSSVFIRQFDLQGPLGVNLMLARSDAYSVGSFQNFGSNYCPFLLQDALNAYGLSFASGFSPRANLNVTFQTQPISFRSCCGEYTYPAMRVMLEPLKGGGIETVHVRSAPNISIERISDARYFDGKLFTLMLVDAQPEMNNRNHNGLTVHWQMVNIPGQSVAGGQELLGYVGLGGQLSGPHLYVYLLLEQTRGSLPPSTPPTYAGNCTGPLAGRCEYRVQAFMQENGLKLVGVNWQRLTPDPYTRHLAVTAGQVTEAEACRGVEGFDTPCPVSAAPPSCPPLAPLLLLLLLASLRVLQTVI